MPATPAVCGSSSSDLDRALAARTRASAVAHFVDDVAPGEVMTAVRRCLGSRAPRLVLHLVRTKLKPGAKLTAEYAVLLPRAAAERRIAVTWVADGARVPGPARDQEAEARRRGVLSPFRRTWTSSDDGRMSVAVAPVDAAFPQLVRLHDPVHLLGVLGALGAADGLRDGDAHRVTVETVRYRPGQRHVLRVGTEPGGRAWFAKVYRDDTGRHAVAAAAAAAKVFTAARDRGVHASSGGGTWVAADRVAWWPEVPGLTLAELLVLGADDPVAAAGGLVRSAGAALRRVHDTPPAPLLRDRPDALAHVATTVRTAAVVDALLPAAASRLRQGASRALESFAGLPGEPPTTTHGDVKCDNLLAGDAGVHLLDFDRSGRGDPAADIGNLLADLRWQTDGDGPATAALHAAFLDGYGPTAPARLARARVHDGLCQLRMAARRVPVHDPGYEARVTRAVELAAATLAGAA